MKHRLNFNQGLDRSKIGFLSLLVLLLSAAGSYQKPEPTPQGSIQPTNLEPLWDTEKICHNPHKGWYLHYFDNSLDVYGPQLAPDDFLEDFPGLNDIYLRLAWSYLEPEEGNYNWTVIDTVISRWVAKGHTISFRISCKETNNEQAYATPKWVRDAGAKGKMIYHEPYNSTVWEPDYGDPIFLEKLDQFHAAFALRYDGEPWVEYIDIGSYGDWGEGHTSKGSKKDWPFEVLKQHIDIHTKHYTKTPLLISDDIIGSRLAEDGSKEQLKAYIKKSGISWRDDSACLRGWDRYGFSTLRNPELFEDFWPLYPINLEMGHYGHHVKKYGTWKNGKPFERAIEESHATYIGFHGDAREWLKDNPEATRRLVNKVGYWYFPKRLDLRDTLTSGIGHKMRLIWLNKGVAPAYYQYALSVRFVHDRTGESFTLPLSASDNKRWMPGRLAEENYTLEIPKERATGLYQIEVRMMEPVHEKNAKDRPIALGLSDNIKTGDHFYRIAQAYIQ